MERLYLPICCPVDLEYTIHRKLRQRLPLTGEALPVSNCVLPV